MFKEHALIFISSYSDLTQVDKKHHGPDAVFFLSSTPQNKSLGTPLVLRGGITGTDGLALPPHF